ncbi:DUF4920 domain-containing protein [Ascidiimonas aurantiaca]|uniref:DUF4920 domain-containing protein n=1 Tax=Ascidiimonas aurantiaca TaxID=1685432 RepID=UPI0030EEF7F9
MKRLLIPVFCMLALAGCKENKDKDKETVVAEKEIQPVINEKQEVQLFGETFEPGDVYDSKKMALTLDGMEIGDSINVQFTAKVNDVCKAKGCWMKLDLGKGEEMMVKFKDYGFFVPMDIDGKEVVINGKAFIGEMSVDEQRHYAEDAGSTPEEIAAITIPKKTYSYEAVGVIIKQ